MLSIKEFKSLSALGIISNDEWQAHNQGGFAEKLEHFYANEKSLNGYFSYPSQENKEIPIIAKAGYELLPRIHGSWVVYVDDSNNLFAYNLGGHEDRKIASASVSAWEWAEIYGSKVVWSDNRKDSVGDIYTYDLQLGTEKIISSYSGSQSHPYIYKDIIVWQDDRNGNWDIYMYDLVTSKETAISTDASDEMYPCVYGKLVIWWTKNAENSFWGYHLTSYNIDTKQKTQLNNLVMMAVPLDMYENRIVYQDMGRTGVYEDIFMFDLNTNMEIPICTKSGGQIRPRIFGDRIVWGDTRNSDGIDKTDVYMYDLSTKEETRITSNSVTNRGGSPMPDIYMNKIVWSDDRNGQCDIYMSEIGTPISAFDPARDSFSFINKGFGEWGLNENVMSFADVANFIINDPVYRLVDAALPGSTLVMIPLVYTYLRNYNERILYGHCYGMSYLVASWFNHPTERPGYPDSTAQSLQLDDELHYLIDSAQQSQLLDFYTFVRSLFVKQESFQWSNLKEYTSIKELVRAGMPTIMGIYDKDGYLGQGNNFYHAVVVYEIDSSGSTDTLLISDPNKRIETYLFDTARDNLGINFRIMAMGVTDQELFDKCVEWLVGSLTFWVHSPVQLHVYNSLGRHVGMDASGNLERGFEATFLKTGDTQLVFISKPTDQYMVKLVGIGSGTYNLTMYRAAGNKVASDVKTGTVTEGQTVEYEVAAAGGGLILKVPGLFGISWLTWPIFGAFIAVGIGAVIIVLSIARRKLKKMPQAREKERQVG
jgi:beta propeller repeat protein